MTTTELIDPKDAYSRVIAEQRELQERLDKLNTFINKNPAYKKLNRWQQELMTMQVYAMMQYNHCLVTRLEHWYDDKA